MIAIALATILTCTVLIQPMRAASVAVRHTEGLIHGFLKLSTLEGKLLATGDLTQVARGDRVTNQLEFRFKDGSVRDETTVFSQGGTFRLLTYHLVEKGPTFPQTMDLAIDTSPGQVTVRYTDKGKEKVESNRLELAPDVANGMIFTLLKNINPKDPPTTVPFVAATPKPRLVKLVITPHGEEPFSVDATRRKATRYVLRADIGGFTGAIARLLGKQPPDIYVWVLGGASPRFCQIRRALVPRWPDLAHRANKSHVAPPSYRLVGQREKPNEITLLLQNIVYLLPSSCGLDWQLISPDG